MPRDSNGTYSLPAGNPVVTLTTISSTWANTTLDDIGDALTDSLDRAGSGGMTGQLKLANGLVGAPGLTWSSELNAGLYRNAAGDHRYSIGANDVFQIVAGAFRTVDGSAATPSHSFISDTDTGIYRVGANNGALAANGTQAAQWTSQGVGLIAGAAATPSLFIAADTNTGIYASGADDLGFAAGGVGVFLMGATRVQSSVVHWFADGTAANPSISFFNDGNTGLFRNGADDIRIATNGTDRLSINNSFISVDSAMPFYFQDGSVGAPGISFLNDSNSGVYRIGSDDIGFSTGGTLRLEINSSGTVLYGTREVGYRGLNGNSQNAGYTFVADDRGRSVNANTAGNFTINNSVFSASDIITFINTTGSNCTLVQGSGVTFRLMGATGTTGNRTVADFGVATIIAQSASVFLVGGPGVS